MAANFRLPTSAEPQSTLHLLARLVETSLTLNSTLETEPLLQSILNTAAELLGCEAVSIMLYDEQAGRLQFAAATGSNSQELAQVPVPLDGSLAGLIFKENKPLLIKDVQQEPRHFQKVAEQTRFSVRSLVGVPMRSRDQTIGVLEALNKIQGDFSPDDSNVLAIIASQAAVAIQNARLVQALQAANQQLSQLDQLRQDFMAVASHELRTPLGIILGYASFLKEDADGQISEHATSVLNAALQLQTLVEDMTNMNLLSTGAADLYLEPRTIQDLVLKAYHRVASTAEAKNDHLHLNMPPEQVLIQADSKLLLAFVNLLNNAVRFTPDPGEIVIRVQATAEQVQVSIQDDGIGIAPDQLERIFDQFYQVEDHMTRRYGGLGLGLAIARALVKLHNGKIWAESLGLGQGSTFYVQIPRYFPDKSR
ncbi:MAG: GAF domain-containing protein [Anaerolineales bacterium]|nr:GAF domain-containing protein [Anaerolineales bacterium]